MPNACLMDETLREWQATQARGAFAEIVEAASKGQPQLIRRRDGKEVVVVSRDYFETHKPSLKSYLLTAGYADGPDELDEALEQGRQSPSSPFVPRGALADE
jgi:prevent-host-death family protein